MNRLDIIPGMFSHKSIAQPGRAAIVSEGASAGNLTSSHAKLPAYPHEVTRLSTRSFPLRHTKFSRTALSLLLALLLSLGTTGVKAQTAPHATGIDGTTVYLNDLEDHSWSYYSDPDCPVRSLNPADVTIKYYGNGKGTVSTTNNSATPAANSWTDDATGVQVSYNETANTFVYYKTLERTDGATTTNPTGRCAYTTIPNPFSKRPTYGTGDTRWRGFYAWRVKSVSNGSIYTAETGGTAITAGSTINAETEVFFAPTASTGMEVELEALWARAYVATSGTNGANAIGGNNVGYERNFIVLTTSNTYNFGGNSGRRITNTGYAATVSSYYPDGTAGSTTSYIRGQQLTQGWNTTYHLTLSADTKFENVRFDMANYTMTAAGHNLIIGRGCSGTVNYVRGINANTTSPNYTLRLESGTINYVSFLRGYASGTGGNNDTDSSIGGTPAIKAILGCDYDRATNSGITDNLIIQNGVFYGFGVSEANGITYSENALRAYIKSGKIGNSFAIGNNSYTATASQSIYIGVGSKRNRGHRQLFMEGGEVASIAGGIDATQNQNNNSVTIRITGGHVRGAVYGGAARSAAYGNRKLVVTGGVITGWLGGGCNGEAYPAGQTNEETYGGITNGLTRVYFGGTAICGGTGSDVSINGSVGGIVFGAGKGVEGNTTSGRMSQGTTVVVADACNIERNVYGGGNFGYAQTATSVYVAGGIVKGSVFGGSNQNNGPNIDITMKNGVIEGGLYGGSNATGTISGDVTMNINGGQVGTASSTGNIHGGGYGQQTRVSGNVDLTLGVVNQTDPGVIVYGDVYGGSALGSVNGTAATNDYYTNVTLNAGTINGSLYGGGLGSAANAANVYGPVKVTVNGGSVRKTDADGSGGVYGANNVNGAPQGAVDVVVNGTDAAPDADGYALFAVYGGGNRADYTYGNGYPTVTVNNCDNSIEYVYGGGNAAAVAATDVRINGGNRIGTVFGGGNGTVSPANVTGNTSVNICGGTIGQVFGGSNSQGNIGGTISVNVSKTGDCAMHIDEVYGGGNMAASNAGRITIGCTGDEGEGIGDVYGGARAADITGSIALDVTGGSIERVFGGNNVSGSISGDIAVNVNWSTGTPCGYNYLGYVYGAGNQADYAGNPVVNIKNGTVSHDVFGGGLQAAVAGNVVVNMLGGSVLENLYGGGALAHTNTAGGKTTTVNLVGGTVNNVYGGGLGQKKGFNDATSDIEAYVYGDVTVKLNGSTDEEVKNYCVVKGNIFGCNNLNGSPKSHVLVHVYKTQGWPGHDVTAGKNDDTAERTGTVYEVAAVYGGGNLASYVPSNPSTTTQKTEVIIDGCDDTSIQYVYGGGNAASVPASHVTVNGCYEIGYVFGGGNGKDKLPNGEDNPGANVGYYAYEFNGTTGEFISGTKEAYGTGQASVDLLGGTIHSAFGGSNTKGNVRNAAVAFLDEANDQCLLHIDDIYGGGNEAYMEGKASVKLGCITSLAVIYGGSKKADVGGDIELNITSGHFDRVFGGNNESGNIHGSIEVNIEETGCHPITIGELYGCGNQAPYETPEGKKHPTVNVRSFTSIGRVFGGGYGSGAIVKGNPIVNINVVDGERSTYSRWEYAGSKIHFADGKYDVTLPNHESGAIGCIGEVYGGGNAADVEGSPTVNIGTETGESIVLKTPESNTEAERTKEVKGADIRGNVFGGGNAADVTGKATVNVGRNI